MSVKYVQEAAFAILRSFLPVIEYPLNYQVVYIGTECDLKGSKFVSFPTEKNCSGHFVPS